MPDPKNPGDRTKAYKLRKQLARGDQVANVDKLWLAEYDEKTDDNAKPAKNGGPSKNYGRSRSGREVSFHLKEAAEAEGTGNAAAAAAAAALQAKEEGRRLDSLTVSAIDVLKTAVAVYKDVCLSMKDRMEILEESHVAILDAGRQHYLERVEVEGALMRLQQEVAQRDDDDPAKGLLEMLIAKHLGVQLPGQPRLPRPRRPPPGANGTAKP